MFQAGEMLCTLPSGVVMGYVSPEDRIKSHQIVRSLDEGSIVIDHHRVLPWKVFVCLRECYFQVILVRFYLDQCNPTSFKLFRIYSMTRGMD